MFIRMRNYIKRGSLSNRIVYKNLQEDVWNEVYSLDKEGVVLHDNDIQHIAMIKAKQRNLHNFKVDNKTNMKHNLLKWNTVKSFFFLLGK